MEVNVGKERQINERCLFNSVALEDPPPSPPSLTLLSTWPPEMRYLACPGVGGLSEWGGGGGGEERDPVGAATATRRPTLAV